MKHDEADEKLREYIPGYVCLTPHGQVVLDGEFDLYELERLVEVMRELEPVKEMGRDSTIRNN